MKNSECVYAHDGRLLAKRREAENHLKTCRNLASYEFLIDRLQATSNHDDNSKAKALDELLAFHAIHRMTKKPDSTSNHLKESSNNDNFHNSDNNNSNDDNDSGSNNAPMEDAHALLLMSTLASHKADDVDSIKRKKCEFSREDILQSHGINQTDFGDVLLDQMLLLDRDNNPRIDNGNMFVDEQGNFIFNGPSSTYHRKFSCWDRAKSRIQIGMRDKSQYGNGVSIGIDRNRDLIKDQLFVNASLQRQKEMAFLYESKFDFDGISGELALHLLNLHFNRRHCGSLITYRPAIMDSLANNGPYANKLLLNAIYFSSCLYSSRTSMKDEYEKRFYERFKQLLPTELSRSTIPTISALLYMGVAMTSHHKRTESWIFCGIAYRMIIDSGCHLEVEYLDKTGRFTPIDLEIRRRVFWGAYVFDKTQALYFGRPPMLHRGDGCAAKEFLDTYEELEMWQPYCDPILGESTDHKPQHQYSISTFKARIRLAEIADVILKRIYSVDSVHVSCSMHKQTVAMLKREFENWQKSLPDHLRFEPCVDSVLPPPPPPPPHQITIHPLFYALQILTFRPFLAGGHLYNVHKNQETGDGGECITGGEDICVNAALKICKYTKAYREAFTLRQSAYMLSYCIFTASAILLQHPEKYKNELVFMHTCLVESQCGPNHSFRKPVAIFNEWLTKKGINVEYPFLSTSSLSSSRGGGGGGGGGGEQMDNDCSEGTGEETIKNLTRGFTPLCSDTDGAGPTDYSDANDIGFSQFDVTAMGSLLNHDYKLYDAYVEQIFGTESV